MSVNCFKLYILSSDLQTDTNLGLALKLCETNRFVKLEEILDERIMNGQILPNKEVCYFFFRKK